MARYRKIDPRIWTDEKFRLLTPEQQRIALYILTAQANRIGLFSFSPGKACEDLRTSTQAFQKGFLRVCQDLNWEWDSVARVIYLPTWWRYNQPENANNVIGNLKDLDDLPETSLLPRFCENTTYLSNSLVQTFARTLAKRSPQPSLKRSPSQEQEQEQEQEGWELSPQEIQSLWNSIPGVKTCRDLGKVIRTRLHSRIKEHPERAWWDSLFAQIRASDFLCGRTNHSRGPFQASLSWALGLENLEKVLAGNYDNPEPVNGQPSPCCQFRVSNGRFNKACGEPCVLGSKYCEQHQSVRSVTSIQEVHP